jgi:hypothetical protein
VFAEENVMRSIQMPFLLAAFLLTPASAWALGQCTSPATSCLTNGHHTFTATDYPYTEDISGGTPVLDPITLTGLASTFTEIEGGCVDIGGLNLNGTQAFNALLRAMVQVQSTTAAPGARYEVQLVVDGVEYGWYVRRLRGKYPQFDVYTGTAPALPAGSHAYTVVARLLDAGTITLSNTYTSAFGSPVTNPSVKSVDGSQISISNTFYQPVTDTVSFTNSQPVDFVIQGYFQVNSGTAGQTINIAPFLDGVRQAPITTIAVPPYLYEGANFLSVLPNVAAGSHTLVWEVVTNLNTTVFSNRAIDGVAFPASTYQLLAQSTSALTVQSQASPIGPQPTYLDTACGYWTNILSGTIAADSSSYNQVYEGFVNFTGASTGSSSYGQLWWETYFTSPPAGTDGGNHGIEIVPFAGGVYLVGDTMDFAENGVETVNLWARKVNPFCSSVGGFGTFDVGSRFFWVRHTPISPLAMTCWYR